MGLMNQKAQTFVFIINLFLLITLTTLYLNFANTYDKEKVLGQTVSIGSYGSAIIKAYQDQEGALLYLDLSAEKSLENSLLELGKTGGLLNASCGSNIYSLWNSENNDCIPDERETLKYIFLTRLEKHVSKYPIFPLKSDHRLTLIQKDDKLEIVGETIEKAEITITFSGYRTGEEGSSGFLEVPQQTKNNINQYDDIIQEASFENDLNPLLLKALYTQESGGKKYSISDTGCAGIAQFCYATAQDFFPSGQINRLGDCIGENNCDADIYQTDPRFDPAKAIPASAKYLNQLSNNRDIRDLSDNAAFVLAAYNGGMLVVDEAIKRTGLEDPTWPEVAKEITPELLADVSSQYRAWDYERRVDKVNEIKNYVQRVAGYFAGWGGPDLFSLGTIGTFKFNQNFRTKTDYDLTVYEDLKGFAEKVIDECKDNVADCLEEKRIEYNNNHEKDILPISECEEGPVKIYYDFIRNLDDCSYSWGDDCLCSLKEEYAGRDDISDHYKFRFTNESDKVIVDMAEPSSHSEKIVVEEDLWLPDIYNFRYKDGEGDWQNTYIEFSEYRGDEPIPMHYKTRNFDGVYLWRKEDNLEFAIKKSDSFKDSRGEEIFPSQKSCHVAKQTFRLCAETGENFPIIKRGKMFFEDSIIKFGLTLVDETAPSQVADLEVERTPLLTHVMLSWTLPTTEDLAQFEIYKSQQPIISPRSMDPYKVFDVREAREIPPTQPGQIYSEVSVGKVYYQNDTDSKTYYVKFPMTEFEPNSQYFFGVKAKDNFQNVEHLMETVVLQPLQPQPTSPPES